MTRVDPGKAERDAALAAALGCAAMIAQQVAGKAARDALFLSTFGAGHLPTMMASSAVLSLLGVIAIAWAMSRWSPGRVVPLLFLAGAGLYGIEWALCREHPSLAALTLYLHLALFGSPLISGFWTLINERFDPHSAKRVLGRIVSGGTLGGLLGGLVVWRAAETIPVSTLLLALSGLSVGAAVLSARIRPPEARTSEAAPAVTAGIGAGLEALRASGYLQQIGWIAGLGALASALLDYVIGAQASASYAKGPELLSFFALFQLGVGVSSFLLQTAFSRAALERLGLAPTVALLPGLTALACLPALAIPGLRTVVLARAVEAVLRNSLFRPGYELLFTPIAKARKRSVKTLIDVGLDRLGAMLGGGAAMAAVALAPAAERRLLLAAAALLGAVTMVLSLRLRRGYVGALAESLRSGVVKLDEGEVRDATTRRTLSETMEALDRDKILAEIEVFRRAQAASKRAEDQGPATLVGGRAGSAGAAAPSADPLVETIAELRAVEPARIRAALTRSALLDPLLAPHVIPLLARPELSADALRALRSVAPRIAGLLGDALLDRRTPFPVRRLLPLVLAAAGGERAADNLLRGLEDERFEVRYQCGLALSKLTSPTSPTSMTPTLTLPAERVFAAAQREVEVDRKVWESQPPLDPLDDEDATFGDRVLGDRTSRSMQHVFRLLSLALEREPLELAWSALHSGDERLRGTALEYLENVLPDPIRRGLWPHLGVPGHAAPPRPREQVLDELLRSADAIALSLRSIPAGGASSRRRPSR